MKEPKNSNQLVLWYLYNWKDSFSLKDLINDSMFFKFQTRLSEIEIEHGKVSVKKQCNFINRFGRKSNYVKYKASDLVLIKKLYDLY